MASNTEQRKIDIIINGTKANASVKEMKATVALLNNQLDKLPPGAERTAKALQFKEAKKNLRDTQKELKGIDDASKGALGSLTQFIPFSSKFVALRNAVLGVNGGFNIASAGANRLKLALISTGIGAIVVILGTLVTWLTTTQEGMDKVTSVTRPLQALFSRLLGVLQVLGGVVFDALVNAWNSGQKKLSEFIGWIRSKFLGPMEAVGNVLQKIRNFADSVIESVTGIEGATGKIGNAIKQVGDFVKDSLQAGAELDRLTKQIEKSEIELTRNRAKLNVEFNKQKEIAQDLSKSESDRIAAARAAQAAQNQLLEMEQGFLDLKIEKMKLEHSLNDTSREDQLELARLEAERTNFEATAAKKRASAKSLENTAVRSAAAEREKIEKEQQKLSEDLAKKELQVRKNIEDLKILTIADANEREIAELELTTQRKIEALIGTEEQITQQQLLLEEERNLRLRELKLKHEEEEKERLMEQALLDEEQKLADEELAKIELETKFQETLVTEMERDQILFNMKRAALQRQLDIAIQFHGAESVEAKKANAALIKAENAFNQEQIENKRRATEAQRELDQQKFAAAQSTISGLISLLSQEEGAQKKNVGILKALKVAEVVTAGISEVQKIWETMAGLGPFGAILGGIQTGIAVARTGIALSKIKGVQFAKGGSTIPLERRNGVWQMMSYNPFRTGGMQRNEILANAAEGGRAEYIIPNWMLSKPPVADFVQIMEGIRTGRFRAYQDGGPTSNIPISAGQPTAGSQAQQESFQLFSSKIDQLIEVQMAQNEQMNRWIRELRVINDPRDIEDGMEVLNEVRRDSTITE